MTGPVEFPGSAVMAPPPAGNTVTVLPIPGPVGADGPQGEPGDPGGALAFVYTTSSPAMTHQIIHGLPFKPAGIVCQDTDGATFIGWTVTHPAPGITEVSFGVDVTPTIFLS
jgi:hypothetical protein